MRSRFKPGDLVLFNDYGFFVLSDYQEKIAIVVSESYSLMMDMENLLDTFYIVYDILVDGELFKMVPEEFIEPYNDEKIYDRMEKVDDGDESDY